MKTDDISSSRENIAVSLVGTSSSSPGGSEDMKKSPVESGVSSATSHTSMPGNIRVLNINVGVLGHVDRSVPLLISFIMRLVVGKHHLSKPSQLLCQPPR